MEGSGANKPPDRFQKTSEDEEVVVDCQPNQQAVEGRAEFL